MDNFCLFEDIFDDEKLANASIFLARDQTGCRLIQKRIENNPSWGTDKIFPIIFNSNMFLELILDELSISFEIF